MKEKAPVKEKAPSEEEFQEEVAVLVTRQSSASDIQQVSTTTDACESRVLQQLFDSYIPSGKNRVPLTPHHHIYSQQARKSNYA